MGNVADGNNTEVQNEIQPEQEVAEQQPVPEVADAEVEPETGPLTLAARTLSGDLRDFVLDLIRDQREPWPKLSESQQSVIATRVQDRCAELVTQAVEIIAARDFPSIAATLKEAKVKDGIEAKLVLSRYDSNRHALMDAAGSEVLILLASAKQFLGARGAPKIDRQALFDAPPIDNGEPSGEAIGPLFAAGQDAVSPDDAYGRGWDMAMGGEPYDANPYAEGAAREQWNAGWLNANIKGLEDTSSKKQAERALADAKKYFRDLGRDAALAGSDKAANPFPEAWPAHNSWAMGWEAGRAVAAQLAASDAAAVANGEAVQP